MSDQQNHNVYEGEPWLITLKHKGTSTESQTIKLDVKKQGTEAVLDSKSGLVVGPGVNAEHSYPTGKVADDEANYVLVADATSDKGSKTPVRIPQTCKVWPTEFTVLAVDAKNANFVGFEFTAKQGAADLTAAPTNAQGKSVVKPAKEADPIVIAAKPPFRISKKEDTPGKLREVKCTVERLFDPVFVKPTPPDDNSARKQYVNLVTAAAGTDGNGTEVEIEVGVKADAQGKKGRSGDIIYIQAKFGRESGRNDPLPELKDVAGLAKTDSDKTQTGNVTLAADDGTKKFKVVLGKAGGETCEIRLSSVKDTFGDTCPVLKFETWRKLYFQMTTMTGLTPPSMADAAAAFKLVNVEFEEDVASKVTLTEADAPAGAIVDGTKISSDSPAKTLVVGDHNVSSFKAKFKNAKAPTAHIILCQQQLDAAGLLYDATLPVGASNRITWPLDASDVAGLKIARTQVTPASTNILFFPIDLKDGSSAVKLCKWTCVEDASKTGNVPSDHIVIDQVTHGNFVFVKLPADAAALITGGKTLRLAVKIAYAKGWYNGWCTSAGRHNVIKVGRPDKDVCSTIVHECGHAIKQAATEGAAFPGLTAPPHGRYYTNNRGHQGGHCADGIDQAYYDDTSKRMDAADATSVCTCIMFGAGTSVRNADPKFCAKCKPYVLAVEISAVTTP